MPTRKIREVIEHRKILTCTGDLSVREATRRMVAAHVGAVMITRDGRLVGIFTERDALARVLAQGRDPDRTTVAEVMTPEPHAISPDRSLGHALHLMYDGNFRHMPVVDAGCPVGMVSVRDALAPELMAFEEELHQRDVITELL